MLRHVVSLDRVVLLRISLSFVASINFIGRVGSLKCLGDEGFCDLPLHIYTFPATHNSGAFKLSNPTNFVDMLGYTLSEALVGQCFFENHRRNYYQQLESGVRFFNVDVCKKNDLWYNCHSRDGTAPNTAFGEPLATSLATMKDWLRYHPEEIIALQPANLHNGANKFNMRQEIEKYFGPCVPSRLPIPPAPDTGFAEDALCMELNSDITEPGNKTLGNLIKARRRFIYTIYPYESSFRVTVDHGQNLDTYLSKLQSWARNLPAVNFSLPTANPLYVSFIDLFRALKLGVNEVMQCTDVLAKEVNEEMLIGDDVDEFEHAAPTGTVCEGVECKGYRSRLEYIHQLIIQNGWTLGAVGVDYTIYGELRQTVHRLNQANLRKFKGLPEPGYTWWEKNPWIFVIFALACVIPTGFALLCVAEKRPHWYPRCLRKTCCDCKKRKRRIRRKAKEAEKDARQAEQQKIDREIKLGLRSANALDSYGYSGGAYGYPSSQMPPSSGTWHAGCPSSQMAPSSGFGATWNQMPAMPPSSGGYNGQQIAPQMQQVGWQAPAPSHYGQMQLQASPQSQQYWPAAGAGVRVMPPAPMTATPMPPPRPFQPTWHSVGAPAGNALMPSPWQQQYRPQQPNNKTW